MTITARDIQFQGGNTARVELEAGWYAIVRTEQDEDMGEPWVEHDGHGVISRWRPLNSKRAGERVLVGGGGQTWFYDIPATIKLARKDGWGCTGGTGNHAHPTKGQQVVCAVEQDYDRMRAWCNGAWEWIGVIVKLYDADGTEVSSDSVWGIESDGDYWKEVAAEIIDQLADGIVQAVQS